MIRCCARKRALSIFTSLQQSPQSHLTPSEGVSLAGQTCAVLTLEAKHQEWINAYLEDKGLHLILKQVEADLVGEEAVILQAHAMR